MAEDNARPAEEPGALDVEKKLDGRSSSGSRSRESQRVPKIKEKCDEDRLPTPPPDPTQCSRHARDRGATSRAAGGAAEEDEEDLAAYLGDLGASSPLEGHSFDYDTPNSATSAMGGTTGAYTEEAFEHLDRLCALTEQILELRDRSCKFFQRVRGLERAKALRSADRRLESLTLMNDGELLGDLPDEDTGFAESLLDAMLSNCRDQPAQRRCERAHVRSPSSSRQRSRSLAMAEQMQGASSIVDRISETDKRNADNVSRNGGPKVSKWTRVKAAFKWERACTNDLAEIAESSAMAPSTPTAKFLKIPEVTAGSWSGSALSPCTSEISSPSTPIGRVSSASSSNDEVFDDTRKHILSFSDRQSLQMKDDRKKDDLDRYGRSFDCDTIAESTDSAELSSEASRDKPMIRVISDADATMCAVSGGAKNPEAPSKRPTPILTITIPSNEEEIKSLSSPESMSPLPSSTQDSGGSSPQRFKARQNISSPREFKRQYSTIEEAVAPAPKMPRQDSKWNKVRRAFLTNATFGVPPSPIRMVAAQSFASDGTNSSNNNYCRAEAPRDYQGLREKFGAEFHRKLVEWERLKSGGGSSRALAARNARDGLSSLNEERLAPEFKRKLQDWKRAKKGRRSNASSFEQQRVSRRRLTDWQLWRSSSKPEPRCYGKSQNLIGSRGSCTSIGSAGSFGSDEKQHLCEDFVKRMEAWRRMSEAACRSGEGPKSPAKRVASDIIDETEFLALEKLLLLFGQKPKKERRESDAKQLNDCFDSYSRFTAASRGVSCGNEVLIRTSVGSYRFEGISREFTRKLYDWEKYRGISPRSSTFRLLGPGYTPFAQDSDEAAAESPSTAGKNRALHWSLKRSKSDGSVFEGSLRDESYALRRSASLQSLISTDKLKDDNRMDILPASNDPQNIKDPSEDAAVDDSEPEAMIVDIEDVIEETASPLKRVQPHQTPVYSVAASETTSIAVPLGTVTSSHEPSPVFLVEAEDDDCDRWNNRAWIGPEIRSSENSPSPEHFPVSEEWRERTTSLDEDKASWRPWCGEHNKGNEVSAGWTEKMRSISDDDSVKFERATGWNRDAWSESSEIFRRYINDVNRDSMRLELSLTPSYESNINKSDTKKQTFLESGNDVPIQFAKNSEATSASWNIERPKDSPRAFKRMSETKRLEDPGNKPNSEQRNLTEDQGEDGERSGKTTPSADSHTYQSARTLSLSDCCDSRESSPNLSNLNLDDNKDARKYRGADAENEAHYEVCPSLPELRTDVDRHYEILTFRTDTRDDNTTDATDNRFLYEPIDCRAEDRGLSHDDGNNHARGGPPVSRLPGVERPNLSPSSTNHLIESTVRTTPITVSKDNETRCLERILINEETLNKIIVPTCSTESGTKSAKRPRDGFADADRTDEVATVDDRDRASTGTTVDHQATVKKDGAFPSPRNVFVKTKRMIFGPFRRSEDRPAPSRKESDGSVDVRFARSKSKSKSRSASPKLCRQDVLLRMSRSLPWPLRSTSKESEAAGCEVGSSSGGKTEDASALQRKSSPCSEFVSDERRSADNERHDDQLTYEELSSPEVNQPKAHQSGTKSLRSSLGATSSQELPIRSRITLIEPDSSACRARDEVEHSETRDKTEANEVECGGTRKEGRRDQARQWNENRAKSDVVSSDLMHKLRILSDAAARREGRSTSAETPVAVSSLESRSSRIRRAKENFLSRQGGPFCRSISEAAGRENEAPSDPWRRRMSHAIATTQDARWSSVAITPKSENGATDETEVKTAPIDARDRVASSKEEIKIDAREEDRAIDVALRPDLVKSASVGMINVDPDTFERLVADDRGCESLPRTIAKRRDSSGPLAKIVGKLKLSRLIRARHADGGSMSTISTLCRQSLMIDTRRDAADQYGDERQTENGSAGPARNGSKNDDSSFESPFKKCSF